MRNYKYFSMKKEKRRLYICVRIVNKFTEYKIKMIQFFFYICG